MPSDLCICCGHEKAVWIAPGKQHVCEPCLMKFWPDTPIRTFERIDSELEPEPRDYLAEAHAIIRGETMLLPQVEHLKAIRADLLPAVEAAYMRLVLAPQNELRICPDGQMALVLCREAIANATNRTGEDVQDHYEERRLKYLGIIP